MKLKKKQTRWWISCCYDDTYGCFIDSAYGLFTDRTCGFFVDKCYIKKRSHESRKRTRRWNSSVIDITFYDESSGKMSYKSRKKT